MSDTPTKPCAPPPSFPTAILRAFPPDKAIDVMDEAGARTRIANAPKPPDTSKLTQEIASRRQ